MAKKRDRARPHHKGGVIGFLAPFAALGAVTAIASASKKPDPAPARAAPDPANAPKKQTAPDKEASLAAPAPAAAMEAGPGARFERGRGRRADNPTEIPAKGWLDIAWRTQRSFMENRLMLVAAGVTFYALLATFPAITALISVYGLFTDPTDVAEHLDLLAGFLPAGAMQVVGQQMDQVASHGGGALSLGLVFGIGLALWSANAGMKNLFNALNIVYQEKEARGFIILTATTLGFTFAMLAFMGVALGLIVILPIALNWIGLGGLEGWLLLLRWPLLLISAALGLSVVYRWGPSRATAKWSWITVGGAFAAIVWISVSAGFSWYVESFGDYDETYGSLGAIIGFMTWIWISSIIVLLGAELNAQLEHQTTRDTTIPPGRPMGSRGAHMADTLGQARGR